MNMIFDDIAIPSTRTRSSETTRITGTVPLPHAAKRVVMTDGKVNVDNTETSNGKVACGGKVTLNAICEDDDGSLFSFSASADFSHSLDCEGAEAGMQAAVTAQLLSISTTLSGGNLELDAQADIMCRVEDMTQKRMLRGGDSAEMLTQRVSYGMREKVGEVTTRLREDIVANDIASVIYADANALIRDITSVIDTARVDGILNLNALCCAKDGSYIKLRQNIPFTADVQTKYDNCTNLSGNVQVSDIRLRMTEDEYGLATVEAQLSIELFSATPNEIELTVDAFSPTEPFSCVKNDIQLLLYKETVEQKGICKDTVALKNAGDYASEVFCTARPLVSSATKGEGCIIIDGIMAVNLLYTDKSKALCSAVDNLPFSVSVPTEYDNTEIDARPVCTAITVGAVNEKGVEVSIAMHITADIYELRDTGIVSDTEKCECKCGAKGFVVCFASEGETMYDIAKRFNVSQKDLSAANPDLGKVLHEGDTAVLLK